MTKKCRMNSQDHHSQKSFGVVKVSKDHGNAPKTCISRFHAQIGNFEQEYHDIQR